MPLIMVIILFDIKYVAASFARPSATFPSGPGISHFQLTCGYQPGWGGALGRHTFHADRGGRP